MPAVARTRRTVTAAANFVTAAVAAVARACRTVTAAANFVNEADICAGHRDRRS